MSGRATTDRDDRADHAGPTGRPDHDRPDHDRPDHDRPDHDRPDHDRPDHGGQSSGAHVAETLRDDIMTGRIDRGSPLREETLAARFAVSRRTVRDALGLLADAGLVRHQRHRGASVVDLTADDVRDMYQTRRLLETGAARSWCFRSLPDGMSDPLTAPPGTRFGDLVVAYRRLESAMAAQRGSGGASRARLVVEADLGFHQHVIGLAGSARVDGFFANVATEMVYALAILESRAQDARLRPETSLAEHREIMEALAVRDLTRSVRLIEDHIAVNEGRLVEIMLGD